MEHANGYPVVRIRRVFAVFAGSEGYNLFNDSNGNRENMMFNDPKDSDDSVSDDAFDDFFSSDLLIG